MAATPPKLATKAASEVSFPTWDDLVAEATPEQQLTPYWIPFDKDGDGVSVPCPDGPQYLEIVAAQQVGDGNRILKAMISDDHDRARVIAKMRGVHFGIVDTLTSKILRYYYGLSIETEVAEGNSPAS